MLNKNKIIIFGALAISLLLNIPRLLIMLVRGDLVENFGMTYSEILLRVVVMFCFSWIILSYNINWKTKLKSRSPKNARLTDIAVNAILLLGGVTTLTFFKQFISDYIYDAKSYFFVTFFIYLVVLVILLLLSWLVNLSTQHQQSIIENEQAKRKALHHERKRL